MAKAEWKPFHEIPPVSGDEYLVTREIDSEESTTAVYGQPWAHKPPGWFKMENYKLTRITIVAWDFMPEPYRG